MRDLPDLLRSDKVEVVSVDERGITLRCRKNLPIDLLLDGRRIWSFWVRRDGEQLDDGSRFFEWPETLAPFMVGRTRLELRESNRDRVLHDAQIRLGGGEEPIAVVNAAGRPLTLDKSLKLVETFDNRDATQTAPLLDAIDEVLGALKRAGVDAFIAYGTALGAVRDGKLIGHDSDADLGYVSAYDHPVDVIRESYRVQRRLTEMGFRVTRYSSAALRVHVEETDGLDRGLDVFGGFMRNGILYLMGEIEVPYKEKWLYPLGTATLEGREFPVPANADKFLTATYGPNWRTPDPAFKFRTPLTTIQRFDGWFRGTRKGRAGWYAHFRDNPAVRRTSDVTKRIAADNPDLATFIDIGCGRGYDVAWMAERGVRSIGLDYQPFAYADEAERLADDELVTFQLCNLHELRHVLGLSAWLARTPAPRAVQCVHVIERLGDPTRANLYRAARMMLVGTGGQFHLKFVSGKGRDGYSKRVGNYKALDADLVREELEAAGGTIVESTTEPVSASPRATTITRMVVTF